MPSKRRAYFAWVVVCIVWGTTYLAIRVALDTIPPLAMGGLRYATGGALMMVILAMRGERLLPVRTWPAVALLGILLIGFGNGGVVWAEQYVASGLTAVLIATSPFWMVTIHALFPWGERLTRRRVVGLIVGFSGIVMLVWPELSVGGSGAGFLIGVASTQIACFAWALGSSYSRQHAPHENVLTLAAFEMFFGGIFLLAGATVHREWARIGFTAKTTGALTYLTLAGSVAGFSAYAYALRHLPVATVSMYAFVNPIIAVIVGTAFLAEPFTPRMAGAAAVVLAGMWIVRAPDAEAG